MTQQQRRIRPYPSVPGGVQPSDINGPPEPWEMAVFGDITDKQPELLGRLLEVPRRSRGTIYFDSCGGSAYTGVALATLIRLRGLEADAVVAGECSSAAIMPFAACRRRFVTPHCTLLFHPVRWQSEEDIRLEEAAEWARHFQVMEQDMDQLLSRLFDCGEELLQSWTRPGRFVSGQELIEAGLARPLDLFSGDIWQQLDRIDQAEQGSGM